MLMNDQLNATLTLLRLTPHQRQCHYKRLSTKTDRTLQELVELIRRNKWAEIKDSDPTQVNVAELKLFNRVRDELTVSEANDLILKGTRIVIPS